MAASSRADPLSRTSRRNLKCSTVALNHTAPDPFIMMGAKNATAAAHIIAIDDSASALNDLSNIFLVDVFIFRPFCARTPRAKLSAG